MEDLLVDDSAIMTQGKYVGLMLDCFPIASKLLSLTICFSRTKVLYQPANNPNQPTRDIIIDGTQPENVDTLIYVCSTISRDGALDKEIDVQISKTSQAVERLFNRTAKHAS